MKKITLMFLLLFMCISSVFCFDFSIGFKAGLDISFAAGDDRTDYLDTANLDNGVVGGLTTGAFATFGFFKYFALQPEVLFTMSGFEEKAQSGDDNTKTKILELGIPVLAKFRFPVKQFTINAYGGAEFAFLLHAERRAESGDHTDIDLIDGDDYNNFQIRIALGGGVDIELGKGYLITDFRYCLPLTTYSDQGDNDTKMHNLAFSVGYGFAIK